MGVYMKKNNKITITTLCENSVGSTGLIAEWGLSLLVEDGRNTILFDTGLTTSCIHNASALNKDLSKIDKIVLSHGHFDHTGGLFSVLKSINNDLTKQVKTIEVIAHPDIWQHKFVIVNEKEIWAGIPFPRAMLENQGASFKASALPTWLTDNIVTTGEIKIRTDFEPVEKDLVIEQDGKIIPDPLADDQALIIKTSKGLIILLGCSHRGVINTLLQAQEITNEKRIYMLLGGTHLSFASSDRVDQTISALKQFEIQKMGVSHCTGLSVAAKLANIYGDKFFFNTVGTSLNIEQ